jgi:hypothetical protein
VKEQFIDWAPRDGSADIVTKAEEICLEWGRQGYDLTLRQLYYQFVARDIIPNTFQSYKRLGGIVDQARLAGLLDWSYIVDRTRNVYQTDGADTTPEDAIDMASRGYQLPRWDENQPAHVEIWVEKDALSGIVQRAANEVNVNYFACRGYVSQSEMYDSGKRFGRAARRGKEVHVYHLGDHDPSGIDMTRDIRERLTMFAGREVNVHRIALNMDQVRQYNPPPNYAKVTDSRYEGYQALYGDESWELDALDPSVLHDLIVESVRGHIDTDAWSAVEERENRDQALLRSVSRHWPDVVDYVEEMDA